MATRAQVQVVQEGLSWDQRITLYHHLDGYPRNIIPLMQKARTMVGHAGWMADLPEADRERMVKTNMWEAGRAGKAASYLCAADPGGFEPEEGHARHGDIEWYYTLHVVNERGGSTDEMPPWFVTIESVYGKRTWDRLPLDELDEGRLKEIERD